MSFIDKLKFWKPTPRRPTGIDLGTTQTGTNQQPDQLGLSRDPLGLGQQSQYNPNQFGQQAQDPFNQQQNFGFQTQQQFGQPQNPSQGQQNYQSNPYSQNPYANQQQYAREIDDSGRPQQRQQHQQSSAHLEVVSAKLDALKVSLDMINQRLNVIEKELQNRHRGW